MSLNLRAMPSGYTAIIFDFDGVIVDSEKRWAEVENPYISMHTTGWLDEDYDRLIGMGLSEVYELLVAEYNFSLSKEQYFSDYDELADTLYTEMATTIEGVVSFLEYLSVAKYKIAIASSSKPTWIKSALKRHNIISYFSVIVSSHDPDIIYGKPAPDVYIKAARELSVSRDEIIVIEDSSNGIRAAKDAGMFCIGLNVDGESTQDMSRCDLEVTSYDELLDVL